MSDDLYSKNYPWAWSYDPEIPLNFDDLYTHYRKWATQLIFELIKFDDLPETVSETFLKMVLFLNGKVTFFKTVDGELLALYGAPSEIKDVYYIPTGIIVNNPYFKTPKSYDLTRSVDCVVVYCTEPDKYTGGRNGGLYMLIHKIATMLADNDISINVAQKNTRLTNIIAADDTTTKKSVDFAMAQMYAGKPTVCVQSTLVNTMQAVPISSTPNNQYLIQLVELRQYILSQFYAQLGIYVHDNMKKERLITDEITDGDDMAYLNIENIFECVKQGITEVNTMFNTDIKVTLNPLLVPDDPAPPAPASDADQDNIAADQSDDSEPETEPDDQDDSTPAAETDPAPAAEPAEPEPPEVDIDITVNAGDAQSDDSEPETEPDDQDDSTPAEPEPPEVDIDITVNAGDGQSDDSSEPDDMTKKYADVLASANYKTYQEYKKKTPEKSGAED